MFGPRNGNASWLLIGVFIAVASFWLGLKGQLLKLCSSFEGVAVAAAGDSVSPSTTPYPPRRGSEWGGGDVRATGVGRGFCSLSLKGVRGMERGDQTPQGAPGRGVPVYRTPREGQTPAE